MNIFPLNSGNSNVNLNNLSSNGNKFYEVKRSCFLQLSTYPSPAENINRNNKLHFFTSFWEQNQSWFFSHFGRIKSKKLNTTQGFISHLSEFIHSMRHPCSSYSEIFFTAVDHQLQQNFSHLLTLTINHITIYFNIHLMLVLNVWCTIIKNLSSLHLKFYRRIFQADFIFKNRFSKFQINWLILKHLLKEWQLNIVMENHRILNNRKIVTTTIITRVPNVHCVLKYLCLCLEPFHPIVVLQYPMFVHSCSRL